jgi:transcriptional regulator with XRE-family HTH domain
MDEDIGPQDGQLPLLRVGDRLREARERAGMTLQQLSADTRIPERHLILIEKGDFAVLPAKTYATGFARSYARAVGLDERAITEEVRAELAANEGGDRYRAASFEPGDPARIPSRGLALFSMFALILLIAGGVMFYNRVLAPGSGPGSLLEEQRLAQQAAARNAKRAPAAAAVPAAATGPVVFTALEDGLWVKFYDGSGAQLMQKQMAKGESYTVPAEATGPQVWTGRPDALAITVGGKAVPKLAEAEGIMKDVPVTAQALLDRDKAAAKPGVQSAPEGT